MAIRDKENEPSWVGDLRAFLRDQKGVQAIRVRAETQTVYVATFGTESFEDFESPLRQMLVELETQLRPTGPEGTHLSVDGLWVRSENEETVVEKTQCPAVRSLWTWRDYEWPSDDSAAHESEEEWKWMALLAGICGVTLIAAFAGAISRGRQPGSFSLSTLFQW